MTMVEESKRRPSELPPITKEQASIESSTGPLIDNVHASTRNNGSTTKVAKIDSSYNNHKSNESNVKGGNWEREEHSKLNQVESEMMEGQMMK
jgi:hypothetical protein